MSRPLVLGTAGHVDHGKTALVGALTGVQTDRLEEERRRGISIELGYAPLDLPSGRRCSVVDVPGHERLVRTMVAGATGIDRFLLVVAADDGVMPQTTEHAAVLEALGVRRGVVAVTKADLADPARAEAEARELVPHASAFVAVSVRTGEGLEALRAALDAALGDVVRRGDEQGRPGTVLHVDRAFTIRGAGTVVTGTLWSGEVAPGDRLRLEPAGREVRVRSVQVHDEAVERAGAGQRVAVNLAGTGRDEVARGDVLATAGTVVATTVLDLDLRLRDARHGDRVHLHHGTREAPARLAELGDGLWQARLERPVVARAGDHVVVRRVAPPDTLGGGVVLDAAAHRHGRGEAVLARLQALRRGETPPEERAVPPGRDAHGAAARGGTAGGAAGRGPALPAPLGPAALALEGRLREAGHEPPRQGELDAAALAELRAAGRALRVGRDRWAHPDAAVSVRAVVERLAGEQDGVALADLRDALGTGRQIAQAWLEHLDAAKVTLRRPDDRRVLRGRRATAS